jgi:hypothetical protein
MFLHTKNKNKTKQKRKKEVSNEERRNLKQTEGERNKQELPHIPILRNSKTHHTTCTSTELAVLHNKNSTTIFL